MERIALITGATSGIGQACARRFAQGGYNLILTARWDDKLQEVKQQLEKEGVEVLTLTFDVRDREAAHKAFASCPTRGRTSMCWLITPDWHVALSPSMRATTRIGTR